MKKYIFVASIVSLVLVVGTMYLPQHRTVPSNRSVEFNIAELSPNGDQAGYAMPASGGSPPSSKPGVVIGANPVSVPFGDPIAIAWYHGTVPSTVASGSSAFQFKDDRSIYTRDDEGTVLVNSNGENGFIVPSIAYAGGKPKPKPVPPPPPSLAGILQGLSPWRVDRACVAICNLDKNTCDESATRQWFPLNRNKKGIAPIAWSDISSDTFASIPGVVQAGSGGGASSCNNANGITGTFLIDTGANGAKGGNYLVGIKGAYSSIYPDGDHKSIAHKTGSDTVVVSVGVPSQPELVSEVAIAGKTFPAGTNLPLDAVLINLGTGATDLKNGENGLFGYTIKLDVNNDGFNDGVNGDITFTSGNVIGPLANHLNPSSPWKQTVSPIWSAVNVVAGTHGIEVCVDTGNTVTEIQEGNNCTTATFTVVEYDIAAYAQPVTYYAVYGEPLQIKGYAVNIGKIPITTPFDNEIEIRNLSGKKIVDSASVVDSLPQGSGAIVTGSGIDHQAVFGLSKKLEYRVWVDASNVIAEVAPDNVRPDTNGNNVSSGWAKLELINPEMHPQPSDRSSYTGKNGNRNDFWGPFVFGNPMEFVFAMYNDTPKNLPLTSTFSSILVIDTNGDCADTVLVNDGCIDDRITFTTNGIPASTSVLDRVTWSTNTLGVYRARIYADSNDDLYETNENDNVTAWQTFEVVDSLPGETVQLSASPEIVRKGSSVDLQWNIGLRNPSSCRITQNDNVTLLEPLAGITGSKKVTLNSTTFYQLKCDADGTFSAGGDRIEVKVIPALYES